jgi:RimJ/RimL family protein N-acetyltransferase
MRIDTTRLVLRRWRPDDLDPLVELVTHPDIARWLAYQTRDDALASIERYERSFEEHGFGRFAVEDRRSGLPVGRVGVIHQDDWAATAEQDEIGWAISRNRWGEGLATEAAAAAIADAFDRVGLGRVMSWTLPDNVASRRVMEKCGMSAGGVTSWKGADHVWYAIDAPSAPGV